MSIGLEVEELQLSFGGLQVLRDLSLHVDPGRAVAIVGDNGAGKTSLLNVLSRFVAPQRGRARFDGVDLLALPPHRLADAGIARSFQNLALIERSSVLDNVLLGRHHALARRSLPALLGLPSARRAESRARAEVAALLDRLGLAAWRSAAVGMLPYGLRKRVELARALAASPRLLLLDEVASGLSAGEAASLAQELAALKRERGLTLVFIEHDMNLVRALADEVIVLEQGRVRSHGPVADLPQTAPMSAARMPDASMPARDAETLLSVRGLTVSYGAAPVCIEVDLDLRRGEVALVRGPNGAGKSTLLKALAGLLVPQAGEVRLGAQPVTGLAAEGLSRRGLVLVPEGRQLFAALSVEQNLRAGAHGRARDAASALMRERIEAWFPVLRERRREPAGLLSGGEQQMLAIGRGLMRGPQVLLLDEPLLGLAPALKVQLLDHLRTIAAETGLALLIAEPEGSIADTRADRVWTLSGGRLT